MSGSNVLVFGNNDTTTIAGAINSTATTVNLAAGTGALFPTIGSGQAMWASFTSATPSNPNTEIVLVTNITGDVVTMSARGQQGTAAQSWNANDVFSKLITGGDLSSFSQPAGQIYSVANITATGAFSWVVPAGCYNIDQMIATAPGGGGAGGTSTQAGGGGGAGATALWSGSVTPGITITGTIGTPGTAGATGVSGGNATATIVVINGVTITLGGGQGGSWTPSGGAGGVGGVGTSGLTGIVLIGGGAGGDGSPGLVTYGGQGAASFWGGGGRSAEAGGSQTNGVAYGSGGGASYSSTAGSGGTGGGGIVTFRYHTG